MNPDLHALLLIDAEGSVRAAAGAQDDLVTSATAFVRPIRELMDRSTAQLGCGALRATLIEGAKGSIALADVDGERTLLAIGVAGSAPGSLRADAMSIAAKIAGES
jgi:predicted regulator of Ras-like GTPase activity (Roadblock/LC7/MglB family)